jgi:hypothetical protein
MPGKINTWSEFQTLMDDCCTRVNAETDYAPHGRWWRNMGYAKFISDGTVEGERIVAPGDPENSRLVQALEGRPPFGPGKPFRRMPPDMPFDQSDIDEIRDWIARGCPDGASGVA